MEERSTCADIAQQKTQLNFFTKVLSFLKVNELNVTKGIEIITIYIRQLF